MRSTRAIALSAVLGLASFFAPAAVRAERALDVWMSWQKAYSAEEMLSNILSSGAVIASPSLEPDYRFHWVRDGALTLDVVRELKERSASPVERERALRLLWAFAEFSRRNQLTPNPSGPADGLGLGEPKFHLDGSAYNAPWGRPQNDGPALRASTLIRFAHRLLDQGREADVRARLYDPTLPSGTVIKADLEFVSHQWRAPSFDLWEEVSGTHFYTRLVQRAALVKGAALATRLGDFGAAHWYRSQAKAIEDQLSRHWDSRRQQITATLDRNDGIDYKSSGLDIAVVLAVLHADSRGIGQGYDLRSRSREPAAYTVHDPRVLATAQKIDEAFHHIYRINSRTTDGEGLQLGTAIGRYPEDRYSGVSTSSQGNPWFLATTAMAELCYRVANAIERDHFVKVTAASARFFNPIPAISLLGGVQSGETLRQGRDARFSALVRGLREKGDAYMRRVRLHADPRGPLSEQFNRDSGYMQSAEELTWSHAALLTSAWARSASVASE
jgi:glucoamylase